MIRKKIPVESVRVADLKVGIRKKLGVATPLMGHVLFECPRCRADAVMTTPGTGYQPKCTRCPHTTPVQKDEHLAATTWNVTP